MYPPRVVPASACCVYSLAVSSVLLCLQIGCVNDSACGAVPQLRRKQIAMKPGSGWFAALERVWEGPPGQPARSYGQRKVLLLGSLFMVGNGLGWGVYFANGGQWLLVTMDLGLAVSGANVAWLTLRGRLTIAAVWFYCAVFALLAIQSVVFDVPNHDAPRSVHLYYLPLAAAAMLAFRHLNPRIRHGAALASLAAMWLFASWSDALFPEHVLSGHIRIPGTWVQSAGALGLLYAILAVQQNDSLLRSALERELRDALAAKQFELYFQPIVDRSGSLVAVEALLRWQHPVRGTLTPGAFLDLAIEVGLMPEIDNWVLRRACAQLQAWTGHPTLGQTRMAVNVSRPQLAQPNFVDSVLSALDTYGIDGHRLELELTENLVADDLRDVQAKLQPLRERGVRLALDDFGSGYSSLGHLRRLPLHMLKIDQMFVRDLLQDPQAASIVQTVVRLGKDLGLVVLAEGVETPEQHDALLALGCDLFQGYLLGRPQPAPQLQSAQAAATPSYLPAQPQVIAHA